MASRWDPWRGCHRCSEGCLHCYIHKGDAKRGVDTNLVVKTEKFYAPRALKKDGSYKMPSGLVWLCFSSDFLLEDADAWRGECFSMMRERPDLHFHFLTKRIERMAQCLPADWGDGYENVTVGCTVENQANCDRRLAVLDELPLKHKQIVCQPLLAQADIEEHLDGVELVVVGGESDREARAFDFAWVLSLREQCRRKGVAFQYRQCGTYYIKDGVTYRMNPYRLMQQARLENLDLDFLPK